MMKVKPFSYHIPPRRKAYHRSGNTFFPTSESTVTNNSYSSVKSIRNREISTRTSTTVSHSVFFTSPNLFTGGGVGTVLILVLLGFIGVAGQGKISEMRDTSGGTFPSQPLLPQRVNIPYRTVYSNIGVPDEEEGVSNDDALQRRISSMGQYGTKYRNASFSYNYSSYPSPPGPLRYHSEQYKLEPRYFKALQNPPYENFLLSLHGDDEYAQRVPLQNKSRVIDANAINLQSIPKFKRIQEDRYNQEDDRVIFSNGDSLDRRNPYPTITEPPTPNRTSSIASRQNQFLNSKYNNYYMTRNPNTRTNSLRQYNSKNNNKHGREDDEVTINEGTGERQLAKPFFHLSSQGRQYSTPDLDDYDDEDALERFIPGNSSHTSGKLRFRQNSQAEVDSSEENSLRSRKRPRRSVVHLYDMVVCSTGCNPLIFKGYGCYCGFLGSGLTVDGIDKCCAKHDWCYHHAKCPPLLTYFVPYYWRCDHGRPQCVTDFRGWKGVCGAHLCECDRQFAECLKKFPCPRSRAMCVTSPWSPPMPTGADPRAIPFTISRRPRPWRPPPLPQLPPPPGIPLLPFPQIGRLFP